MQASATLSSAQYGGGGHWSDGSTHNNGGGVGHYDSNAAAAASDIFRDFTWYSAMLLSHLFALEHAQLVREAAAEEARRRNASAHSPQLLMRAAMAAANAPCSTGAAAPPPPVSSPSGSEREVGSGGETAGKTGSAAEEMVSLGKATDTSASSTGATENASSTATAATTAAAAEEEVQKLSHLATQHRPHILVGFIITGASAAAATTGGGRGVTEDPVLCDPATRWTPAAAAAVAASDAVTPTSTTSATGMTDSSTTALLAVFDAYYFPAELFAPSPTIAAAGALGSGSAFGVDGAESQQQQQQTSTRGRGSSRGGAAGAGLHDDGDECNAAAAAGGVQSTEANSAAAASPLSGASGAAGAAPRVTAEALREAFHTLLLLGQRCAAFALTYNGIVGSAVCEDGDDTQRREGYGEDFATAAAMAMHHDVAAMGFSSEDELRGGGNGNATGGAAMQQAASASLQFMLQLACNCPCASLAYAAQLCLAHALAVQPTPRTASGWAARQQLLRFLPTLQPPSRALMADASAGHSHFLGTGPASSGGAPISGGGGGGGAPSSTIGSSGNRVPATQYIRQEDPMLWFDAMGAAHVATAQRWLEGQQQQRTRGGGGGSSSSVVNCLAYCGPLPSTTALPTVQRLLMEEEQYMGPNGSAAAVLQSMLEAVSMEVTLHARAIPGSSSALVHTSLRRRRGMHSASGSGSANPRGGSAGGGAGFSPVRAEVAGFDAESMSGGAARVGSPVLPGLAASSSPNSATAGGGAATRASAAATTSMRLSKTAKRRRALLFALAQSHLLPPTTQLATSKTLLYGVFTDGGECPSYYKLLSLYPEILRAHHASLHYVLFEEGPLSVDVRLMVATIAASRHRCEYLVSRFSALLLRYAEEAMLDDDEDAFEYADPLGANGAGGMEDGYTSMYRTHHLHHSSGHRGAPTQYSMGDADDEAHSMMLYGVSGGGNSSSGGDPRRSQHHRAETHAAASGVYGGGVNAGRGQARQRWITQGPPARLRAVQHFIALAAHTPWLLNEEDIRDVLAAGWTIPEVFQLVAIVAQVIPLCGFVMGMFVPAEPWTMTLLPLEVVERLGHRGVAEDAGAAVSGGVGSGGGMTSSGSNAALSGGGGGGGSGNVRRHPSNLSVDGMMGNCPGPATPHYNNNPSRTLLGSVMSGSDVAAMGGATGGGAGHADVYRRFAGEDSVVSEQRIKGSSGTINPHTLWRSQFTWHDVGATAMEQYYAGAATLVNEEIECFFDVVRQLTKADCVGLMSPDYAPSYAFRSLQLYVQNLLGFMVEDYPYNDINKVLRRPAKWFAQVLTMRPETLTRSEVVRWYVPTTPPIGKSSDVSAESSLVTHQLKREIELLSVVDSAQGGHRGGIESASAHSDPCDNLPPTAAEAARDAAEAEALQTALTLQDERVLLLIALATMEARKEGLLHILLRPVCSVLSNM